MSDGDVVNGAVNGAATSKLSQEAPSSGRGSLRDVESSSVYDSTSSKYTSENYRRAVGASYVLTMGVSGVVLVALASSLMDLGNALETTSVAVSGSNEEACGRHCLCGWFLLQHARLLAGPPAPTSTQLRRDMCAAWLCNLLRVEKCIWLL